MGCRNNLKVQLSHSRLHICIYHYHSAYPFDFKRTNLTLSSFRHPAYFQTSWFPEGKSTSYTSTQWESYDMMHPSSWHMHPWLRKWGGGIIFKEEENCLGKYHDCFLRWLNQVAGQQKTKTKEKISSEVVRQLMLSLFFLWTVEPFSRAMWINVH